MKRKKKLLIVIPSDLYIRNYIKTGVFTDLENKYDCHYIANSKLTIRDQLCSKEKFKGFYTIDKKSQEIHQAIFDTLMWKNRRKSTSFLFRSERVTIDFNRVINGPKSRIILRFFKWLIYKPIAIIKRRLIDIDFFHVFYISKLKDAVKPNSTLNSIIKNGNYELVILPASGYAVEGIDIAWICEENNLRCLFLIDNWDNLSSKTIMWKKPTYIGVWGQQAKEHAENIQDIEDYQISLLGTPRFMSYFENRNRELSSHFKFNYILFVGTALNFDEEFVLSEIDKVLENNREIWGDIRLIYRPHPWRQNECEVLDSYGDNIITDPQILVAHDDKSTRIQPDLDYYPSLISNAEFVMGGLTSMLIESLIFYKQFLALVHEDKKYVTNMRNAWKNFEHFRGLRGVEGVYFSKDINDLESRMIDCWKNRDTINLSKMESDRNYYLYEDGLGYQQRLNTIVEKILHQVDI